MDEYEDNDIDMVNTNNFKKIDKYENSKNNNSNSSSLPKDYYLKKNNNFLNLDYSMDNANQNINQNPNIIYNRNNARNKMSFYYTNNNFRNLYRNSFKVKNNFNTNNSYYYLESSYNNNNFKINQINKNIPKNDMNKNSNINRISPSNKFMALNNLFLDFIKQDNNIEKIRQVLSNREDINLIDLFSLFDNSRKKLISASNFIQTLKQLGLIINIEDIKFLFRKFNKKANDCFDFDEFCELILPKKHSNEKIMGVETKKNFLGKGKRGNPNKNMLDGISTETKKILALLFKNVIEGEKSNENYRKILVENEEISGFDLFNKIKKNYSVGIYKEDITNFMKKNKYKLNNNEIELLMDRFDKNKNGMIEYKEFIIEISPISKQ
jgi:Ca2+-binding EF-hand superfamily protein